ncbi:MAG TPA: hypothetical protein VGO51_10635 [Burkholderiaceae bacterium]|nr:hypothetical protein [Burkholderiaceae bacterium]
MSGQISGKPVDVTHTFSMLTSQQIADAFHCRMSLALRWTDAQNYTECRKWQAQVIGWQEYYQKIKAGQ